MKARIQVIGIITKDVENIRLKNTKEVGLIKIAVNMKTETIFIDCYVNYKFSDLQKESLKKGTVILIKGLYTNNIRCDMKTVFNNRIISIKDYSLLGFNANIQNSINIELVGYVHNKEIINEKKIITLIENPNSTLEDNPRKFKCCFNFLKKEIFDSLEDDTLIYVSGSYEEIIQIFGLESLYIERKVNVIDYQIVKQVNKEIRLGSISNKK